MPTCWLFSKVNCRQRSRAKSSTSINYHQLHWLEGISGQKGSLDHLIQSAGYKSAKPVTQLHLRWAQELIGMNRFVTCVCCPTEVWWSGSPGIAKVTLRIYEIGILRWALCRTGESCILPYVAFQQEGPVTTGLIADLEKCHWVMGLHSNHRLSRLFQMRLEI